MGVRNYWIFIYFCICIFKGTWRSHRVCDVTDLIKVRNDIPVEYAATIASNPSTAFRLLSDFVTLKKGDTIIQNAANSMVGVCVNQIAKHKGINVINVVRERPADQQQQLVKKLNSVGAEIIITEEQLASSTGIGKLPKPVLAINSVGGKSATNIARTLAYLFRFNLYFNSNYSHYSPKEMEVL